MTTRTIQLVGLCGFLMVGSLTDLLTNTVLKAHHSLAGVYDLNKETVLTGALIELRFTNPHSSIRLAVKNADGSTTEWSLVTASNIMLTRAGVNKSSIKPGDLLKITILPAKNGNPLGFIKSLELGEQTIKLFNPDGNN
jgi:hypothetical protein